MSAGDIARWAVAAGSFVSCMGGFLAPSLPKRSVLALIASATIGAFLCLSHLIEGGTKAVIALDGVMLALVCFGCGGLLGRTLRRRSNDQTFVRLSHKATAR